MRLFPTPNQLKFLAASLGLVVAFFLLREHWGHALGLLPYLLLIACPLLHLFHGHGGHGHSGQAHDGHDGNAEKPGRRKT